MSKPIDPALHAEAQRRFPLPTTLDLSALGALADQIATQAGADHDGYFYTAGVVETLRWLATGDTTSEFLATVITAPTDPAPAP